MTTIDNKNYSIPKPESEDLLARRKFLVNGSLATAGLLAASAISKSIASTFSTSAKSYGRIIGANDRVQVGMVGYSLRGKSALVPSFQLYNKELNMEIVAVSDIWKLRREEGQAWLKQTTGNDIMAARNNDELYGNKNIDAVIVSTPDFAHAFHCVEAVKAGRDAYIEKPFANRMEDAKAAKVAVLASKQIVQVGTQRRSTPNYIQANEYIRSGKFGAINFVELVWNVNQPGRWRLPDLVSKLRKEDTDWDRFLVNRPKDTFDARKYCEYRLFWPYSSGIPCQWMVHQIDTVHWFTGLEHPRSVTANGGIYQWHDGRKNDDTVTVVFDYGPANDLNKGFQVTFSSRMGNAAYGTRELYFSNGGTLNLETNKVTSEGGLTQNHASVMKMEANLLAEANLSEAVKVASGANTGADASTAAHMKNWMDCVRSRQQPNADINAGYAHSVALCMTIAALHTGKRATFDAVKQEVKLG